MEPRARSPSTLAVLIAGFLPGCAALGTDLPAAPDVDPLIYDAEELRSARQIALFVPGALASVDIFDAAADWRADGTALVFYRLPGMDGLAPDHRLVIGVAGARIAAFLRDYPDRDILLVGYSTGGPIVLTAAGLLDRPDIAVALISPAVERAGGSETRLRGATDILAAAARAPAFDRDAIWITYWQTLLFGRRNVTDPAFADRIARLTVDERDRIVQPDPLIAALHTRDLSVWTLPESFDIDGVKVAIFVGEEDPVFSIRQTSGLARAIGVDEIRAYPDDGHLPFLTRDGLFDDIRRFAAGALRGDT